MSSAPAPSADPLPQLGRLTDGLGGVPKEAPHPLPAEPGRGDKRKRHLFLFIWLSTLVPQLSTRRTPHPSPLPARPGRGDKIRQTWVTGLVIVALGMGFGLRVVALGEKSLWWDELMTVQRTDPVAVGEVIERLRGSPFPPLHYVIVHRWRQWCGSSNESLRTSSALWGLAGLAALAWLGPELIGHQAARWSLVFASLSACHVWYCRDAKMYAAVWTLSLVSLGLFGTELESERPRRGRLLLFGAATGLLPWFSYVGLTVPVAEAGFGLLVAARCVSRRRAVVRLLAVGLVGLLPFVAGWGPMFREALAQRQGLEWLSSPAETMLSRNPLQLLGTLLLGGRTDLEGEIPWWGAACQWLHGPLTLAVLAGLSAQARCERRLSLVWLATAVAVPVAGLALVSWTWLPMWGVARYLIVIHPPLVLLLGRWMAEARPRSLVMTAAIGVLAFNLAWLSVDRICLTRVPWDRIAEQAREIALAPDRVGSSVERPARRNNFLGEDRPSKWRVGWEPSCWLYDAPLAMPHALHAVFDGTPVAWSAEIVGETQHPERLDLFLRAVRLPRPSGDSAPHDTGLPFEHAERVTSYVVRGTPDLPLLVATVEVELWRRRTTATSAKSVSDDASHLKRESPAKGGPR